MIGLDINLSGDTAYPDLQDVPVTMVRSRDIITPPSHLFHLSNNAPDIKIAVLDYGTTTGRPSLVLRIELPAGQVVVAETTARLFCTCARMILAKYPDLFDGE